MTEIRRLIGIYAADGSLRGEVAYAVAKVLGRRHCALCEITHGWSLFEKRSSRACRAGLPVPFDLVHLDERSPMLVEASEGRAPLVLAETVDGFVEVVDRGTLESLGGDPERLVAAIEDTAGRLGLGFAASA